MPTRPFPRGGPAALLAIVLTACGVPGPQARDEGSPTLVLRDVRVVDVERGETRAGRGIAIRDGRIVSIGAADELARLPGAEVVDGGGAWVIPGLWDMHVHVLADRENAFALLVANGVTGVRNLHSTLDDALGLVLETKRALAAGELQGPLLVANGPIVDGPEPVWPGSVAVGTPDEARDAVRRLAADGADFVKVYDRLSRESYFAIADEAGRRGIPFVGHVPEDVTLREASDAGQASVEHASFLMEACTPREREVRRLSVEMLLAFARRDADAARFAERYDRAIVEEHDAAVRDALLERLVANGTWLCPTLAVGRSNLLTFEPVYGPTNPDFAYVSPSVRAAWIGRHQGDAAQAGADERARRAAHYALSERTLAQAQAAGVGILAGTDVGNPYLVPGFSLHDELELYTAAGLSTAQALRSATLAPARFLGRDDVGLVEVGRRADLVLLDADPLADIAATRRIRAVVLGGELLDRAALDALLEQVRERVVEESGR